MEGQSETIRPPRRQWRRGDHEGRNPRRTPKPPRELKPEVCHRDTETQRGKEREKASLRSLPLSVSAAPLWRILLFDLLPILKEIGQADVGQGVFDQLLHHFERH